MTGGSGRRSVRGDYDGMGVQGVVLIWRGALANANANEPRNLM